MSVEKEVLAMLRDTYLFFTIADSLESLSDDLLIQVYLRLLHVLDPNCELQDSVSTGDAPLPADALKHIYKSLRHLELLHLVGKVSQLLDKKTFVRLCTALHDKITARYGSKSSLRIRKIVKAEDLSRRKKKRADKDELPCAEDEAAGKQNALPAAAAETFPGVERKAGGGAAAAKGPQKSSTVASSEEEPTDSSLVVVVPVKGKELARTPVRPQTSDASTGDGSICSSPNTSAFSVHDENAKDCQPIHLSPRPAEQILLPPPLDFDNSPGETDETAPPADLPSTPCLEILTVNYKRATDAAAAAVVNVIPSGRQIARTPVTVKLSGDAQDAVDLENAPSHSVESDETKDDVGESVLHPDCPVEGNSILLDVNFEGSLEVSRNLSDFIIKPPPGFDSLTDADQPTLPSSSDESVDKSPRVLKCDETYNITNATYCASSNQQTPRNAPTLFQETPERLPIFKTKNTYCEPIVDSSAKQPSAFDGTFVVHAQNSEYKTFILSPECKEPQDEVNDTASFKFVSSFDDSDSIFPTKKPKEKNDVKKQLKVNQLKANTGSDVENLSPCKSIARKNAESSENIDKIEQIIERRVRQRAAVAKQSKANLSPPEVTTEIENLAITSKRGRKKKPQAISVDKDAIPASKNAVQPSASPSRSKRQRNVRTVNYCEMSIIDTPNGEDGNFACESETNKENHENELAKVCVPCDKEVKMMGPPAAPETDVKTKQKRRKQAGTEIDALKQPGKRATRSKTEPQLVKANEKDSSRNEAAKVLESKLENKNAQNIPVEVLEAVDDVVVSSEPAKVISRRGKSRQKDLEGTAEEAAPVFTKPQVTSAQDAGAARDSSSSSHSSESGAQKAKDTEDPDTFSRNENIPQKKSRGNPGRTKKLTNSSRKTADTIDDDEAELSPIIGRKGSRKTGTSAKLKQTGKTADKKKLTLDKHTYQDDSESVSLNPSPPKRMRLGKSSSNDVDPDVNATSNSTKHKRGKAKRADSPVIQNLPPKRNIKDKNNADTPAAADTARTRPARGSKLKAKENIASDARDSAPRDRWRR